MNTFLPRPIIGITMGDPLGIGPEIIAKALNDSEIFNQCRPLVLGDAVIMNRAKQFMSMSDVKLNFPMSPEDGLYRKGIIDMIDFSLLTDNDTINMKIPSAKIGKAMETYILSGVDMALENRIQALVTAPITKTGLKAAGSKFHGHTEMIAHRTKTEKFAMMLAGKNLKVVLITRHIPLARVSEELEQHDIVQTVDLTWHSLKNLFGIKEPRLAVAALNPHAGEDGLFGNEEIEIISPAIAQSRAKGMNVQGPLPPDTVFYHTMEGRFDAVVCMYHDQGLIPFKLIHFKDGVNTTLGLPIIRTSVDHGTAYDIAWQGKADPFSLKEAIKMASIQATNKIRFTSIQ